MAGFLVKEENVTWYISIRIMDTIWYWMCAADPFML